MNLFGVDVSNNNGSVDLSEVRREGFDFVFAKVSEGSWFQDAYWPGFRDQAQEQGLILAGYHYIRADAEPRAQAELCAASLGDLSIPVMLDFEDGSGDIDVFWAVRDEIEALGARVRLSYIPRWYWQRVGSPDISDVPGLVQSSYVAGSGYASVLYQRVHDSWWEPYGGATPDLLQFTDHALVAGHLLDASAYQGTRADLADLLGIPEPPPAPLPQPRLRARIEPKPQATPGFGNQAPADRA